MSKKDINKNESGCGCGCETTSSMKDFLLAKPKKHHHSHENCCNEHNHDEEHTCTCHGEELKEEHTHEESGCGCGCETTSSMKDFLLAKPKKHHHSHENCCNEHNHDEEHTCTCHGEELKEEHTHEESGCGCGCETTSSMKDFLIKRDPVHNEHNHKHDNRFCNCTCAYCESIRTFLIDKEQNSHSHSYGHDHDHNVENKTILIISVVLFLIGFTLEKAKILQNESLQHILMMLTSLGAYYLMGKKTLISAYKSVKRGDWFGESFLMTIATIGAILIGEYPEAAAVMLLYNIGEYFQSKAVDKSRRSISELMDIRPDFANLLQENGNTKTVDPEDLKKGDIIVIKSGEKVPVDATIIEGKTTIDNRALTGESIPVEATVGNRLLSGSINISGLIKAKVDREFGESTVSKILELVQNASEKKSTQEKFITRFSKIYTPIVVVLALILAFVVPVVSGQEFITWIHRSLIFLVISCPCALVISVPLSFFAGIGGASKRGILFKGSTYIEQLSKVKYIMFDKTGTLTKGQFEVAEIVAEQGFTEDEILELSAIVEYNSNHPIARSIVSAYERKIGRTMDNIDIAVQEISGFGVKAKIGNDEIIAGNEKLMNEYNIKIDNSKFLTTVVYIAKNNKLMGTISIEDKIKEDAQKSISLLNNFGIETIMLTGDNQNIAEKVSKSLGIKKFFAQLLPQDKVEKVEEILSKTKDTTNKLAFVGDGINDAPVLARADVGIAMGGVGSDAAIEAADIVLMTDEPSKIVEAIKISNKTMQVASQNIILALGIKIVVMILGIVGIANMWVAVFADVGVSIIAILNAMRAYKTQ